MILYVVERCPLLEVLKFQTLDSIDGSLYCAGCNCPRLRALKCFGSYVTGDAMVALVQGCPLLEELDLFPSCPNDDVLHAVAESCLKMRDISLVSYNSCVPPTDLGFVALSRVCPDLTQLDIFQKPAVTEATFVSVADHCHKLQIIRIKHRTLTCSSSLCALLTSNPGLISISLDCPGLIREVILALAHACPKLETQSLEDCYHLTAEPLGGLFNRRCSFSLKHLHLANCTVPDTNIDTLARRCTRLESICLNNCLNITERSLASLLEWGKRLKTMSMYGCALHERDSLSRYYTCGTREGYVRSGPRISAMFERLNTPYHWLPVYYEPHPISQSYDKSSPPQCCIA